MDKIIKIGTRGSKLALWQAYYVADHLKKNGLNSEIVIIETTGDKILHKTIAKIGSKGVFTEELEQQLRSGDIDIAVHSAKDLPSDLAEDLEIIAFTERKRVNDVLVSYNKNFNLDADSEIVLGTSSTRRIAMLRHYYPKVKTVDVRGNLQTRMRKLEEGLCDALVLAYAGVHRMEFEQYVVMHLRTDQFTPAAGQGSVAIEAGKNMPAELREAIRNAVNHPETEYRLLAERGFLRKLQGGCSIPSFALAELQDGRLSVRGGLVSLDGSKVLDASFSGEKSNAEALGRQVAEKVLSMGGDVLLAQIKGQLG